MRVIPAIRSIPLLSLGITGLALAIALSQPAFDALVFDRVAIRSGQVWRVVTGSWVHFSRAQLAMDAATVLVAGAFIENRSRDALLRLVGAAAAGTGIAVLIGEPGARYFGGLSGIAVAAVVYAALLARRDGAAARALGSLALLAVVVRLASDAIVPRVFTGTAGEEIPVSLAAHLGGCVAALLLHTLTRPGGRGASWRGTPERPALIAPHLPASTPLRTRPTRMTTTHSRYSMRCILPAVLLCLAITHTAAGQAVEVKAGPKNAVYFELFGSAGGGALNYERAVSRPLRLRVGFGSWGSEDVFESNDYVAVPVTLSTVRGEGSHHLEFGGGVLAGNKTHKGTFDEAETKSNFFTLTGLVGYRYQKPERGFLFRAGFTPLLGLGSDENAYPDKGLTPSAGVSVGYAF